MEIARRLAAGPKSLAMIRHAYWSTWHSSYEQQLDLEARLQTAASQTHDAAEGSPGVSRKTGREVHGNLAPQKPSPCRAPSVVERAGDSGGHKRFVLPVVNAQFFV